MFAIPTEQGADPCAIRITEVTTTGFQAACLEPPSEDGTHPGMDFHYVAIEPGLYEIPLAGGGSMLVEAGFLDTTTVRHRCQSGCGPTGWETVDFNSQLTSSLSSTPAVLTQVQGLANETNNGASPSAPFLTTSINTGSTTTSGFQVALERSESSAGSVTQDERIGWLALPASPTCQTLDLGGGATVSFEARRSAQDIDGWTNGCQEGVTFSCSFGAAPIVVGAKATRRGNNGGWARRCSLSSTEVLFTIDEDQERDGERNHIDEIVSLVAFGAPVATTLASYTLITDVTWQPSDHGSTLGWKTSGETGAASYHLLTPGPGGALEALLPEPVPALLGAPQGAIYRAALRGTPWQPGAAVWIQETEIDGTERFHGPFHPLQVSEEPRSEESLADSRVAASATAKPRPVVASDVTARVTSRNLGLPATPAEALVIEVRSTGLQGLTWQRLAEAFGVNDDALRAQAAQGLFELTVDGQAVAWGTDTSGQRLIFFGEATQDPLRAAAVYRLRRGVAGPRIETDRVLAGRGDPETPFPARTVFETNAFPVTALPIDPASDLWMWQGFHSAVPALTEGQFTFDLESAVGRSAATARLAITLQGASTEAEGLTHRVGVRLHGLDLGEQRFGNLDRTTLELELPAGWLLETGNTLQIEALGPVASDRPSLFFLDRFEVVYPRKLSSGRDPFVFRPTLGEPTEAGVSTTSGAELLLFSLETAHHPRRLVGFAERELDGRRFVGFRALTDADHLLVSEDAILEPTVLRTVAAPSLRTHRGAEHLVISPAAWRSTAETLSARRRAEGLASVTLAIEDIYDEFSSSHQDPRALEGFLRYATQHWPIAPRLVVLLGDGHLDYRNHSGAGPNPIPPRLVVTTEGLFASDQALADFDGDGVSELVVGRVPATTVDEVQAWLEKLEAWEDAPPTGWRSSALLLADVPDSGGNFPGAAKRLEARLSQVATSPQDLLQSWQSEVISVEEEGLAATRESLLARFDEGVGLLTWVGHGGLDRWAGTGLLTQGDVGQIDADQRAGLVVVLGCNTNRFELPGFASLGGDLTLHPEGGAVAVLAPSGATRLNQTFALGSRWLEALKPPADRGRLGERLLAATRQAATDPKTSVSTETLQVYVLFGDPATTVW